MLTTRCQLRQHFTYKFFVRMSFWQFFYVHVTREKLPKQRLYNKFVHKMLMKLTTVLASSPYIKVLTSISFIVFFRLSSTDESFSYLLISQLRIPLLGLMRRTPKITFPLLASYSPLFHLLHLHFRENN